MTVFVRGKEINIAAGAPVTVPLRGQGPRRVSLEGHHPVIGAYRSDGVMISGGVPAEPAADGPATTEQAP